MALSLRSSVPIMLRCGEYLLLGVIAWQVAGLLWFAFAPTFGNTSLTMPRQIPASIPRDPFFGWYAKDVQVVEDTATDNDYSLLAVIAGKDGVAVLKGTDGVGLAVRVDSEIQPGSKLIEVEPQSVRIERNGIRQQIKFPEAKASPLSAKTAPGVQGGGSNKQATENTSKQPAKLPPIRITRGQMVTTMQGMNVAGWDKGLSVHPEGGLRVEQAAAQPFIKLLQIKDGDLIKRINQRPLTKMADISLISYYFGQAASVDLELIRNGVAMVQHYDVQL